MANPTPPLLHHCATCQGWVLVITVPMRLDLFLTLLQGGADAHPGDWLMCACDQPVLEDATP